LTCGPWCHLGGACMRHEAAVRVAHSGGAPCSTLHHDSSSSQQSAAAAAAAAAAVVQMEGVLLLGGVCVSVGSGENAVGASVSFRLLMWATAGNSPMRITLQSCIATTHRSVHQYCQCQSRNSRHTVLVNSHCLKDSPRTAVAAAIVAMPSLALQVLGTSVSQD
jgi:hypothetical protein